MKKNTRSLAVFLTVLVLAQSLVACSDSVDTTSPNDATELNVTEPNVTEPNVTEPNVTDPADTEPVVTEPSVTEPPTVDPEPDNTVLEINFETDLPLAEYINSIEGTEISTQLGGGEIKDGKWYYNETAFAFKDDCGIYDLSSYSIEFDMCFNTFVNKNNTSIFTFITDDDGALGSSSSFYQLKMDPDGKIYHYNVQHNKLGLEAGKTYHVLIEINREAEKMSIKVDGTELASAAYTQKNNNYNCFRLMDTSRGADVWFDNIIVKDTSIMKNASTDRIAMAIDGAYTRGGEYSDKVQPLANGRYIDIKYSSSGVYYREGFLKFDISKFDENDVKYARLILNFGSIDTKSVFDIYKVDSDWSSDTITYNNSPKGKCVFKNYSMGGIVDLAEPIKEALANGETELSIRIVPTYQNVDGQTRLNFVGDSLPYIALYDQKLDKSYFEELSGDEAKDATIWAWAEQLYSEWYARYKALPAVNENAKPLAPDPAQYTKTNYASTHSTDYAKSKKLYNTRTLEAVTDLDKYVDNEFKNAKLDKYGGIMIESLKQKATGYFYTMKIDGRWWMIDPLGYPFIAIGLSSINYSLNGSTLQKENSLKKYGSFEEWALATTREVRDGLNFNCGFGPRSEIKAVEDGLPYVSSFGVMAGYGTLKGLRITGSGSTVFSENNTMPVFDAEFAEYADGIVKKNLVNQNEARIIGYVSDNELPMDADMLDRSLTVNPIKEYNYYTYACAWTWLKNITGKEDPTFDDITDELRDLYRGFVYDRYFYVVSTAFNKYDQNHMYLGCKFLTKSTDSQWLYRFTAQYVDCMTINWYREWEPGTDALYGIEKNGDLPFMVTEFYTKAGDSGLGNTSGAGWYVATQTDRADFYENFTIKLLESRNCIGWQYFHYMDNDPSSGTTDASSVDSNKGIYNNNYELYTDFSDRVAILNKNTYKLVNYFANKYAD